MKISRTARRIIGLVLVFSAVMMLAGCTSYDNFRRTFIDKETEDSNVIYVGVFEPQNGAYKEIGNQEIQGITLANSNYSNVKGVRVELVKVDTESDTNTAKAAIQDLIKMKPVAIIGSAEEANSMIAAEACEKAKIPMITPSASNPLITEDNPYAFRACITYNQRGTGLADYALNKLSSKKIGIVTIKNDSTLSSMRAAFKKVLKKNGKKQASIVLDESIEMNEFNMKKLAREIDQSGADTVFAPIGLEKVDLLFTQIEKLHRTDITFLGNQEWTAQGIINLSKKHPNIKLAFTSDNVLNSSDSSGKSLTAETQRFLIKYENQYGDNVEPTQNTVLGYDSYMLVINAINNARSLKPTDIKDALQNTNNLRCASGVFNFDKDGNPVRSVNISRVKDGKIITAYVTDSSTKAARMKKVNE
ncbi:MAG: ABC transporter substrate-binding protein [Eubacteriales bacterium]|nr:ABC transporter substrate-binding protein [Eubacteriales bacterium]